MSGMSRRRREQRTQGIERTVEYEGREQRTHGIERTVEYEEKRNNGLKGLNGLVSMAAGGFTFWEEQSDQSDSPLYLCGRNTMTKLIYADLAYTLRGTFFKVYRDLKGTGISEKIDLY